MPDPGFGHRDSNDREGRDRAVAEGESATLSRSCKSSLVVCSSYAGRCRAADLQADGVSIFWSSCVLSIEREAGQHSK